MNCYRDFRNELQLLVFNDLKILDYVPTSNFNCSVGLDSDDMFMCNEDQKNGRNRFAHTLKARKRGYVYI